MVSGLGIHLHLRVGLMLLSPLPPSLHPRYLDEIRSKLDAYSAKIDELEKQKGALKGNIQDKRNEAREKRGELNSMKSKLQSACELRLIEVFVWSVCDSGSIVVVFGGMEFCRCWRRLIEFVEGQ